jgi:hypothetical protein
VIDISNPNSQPLAFREELVTKLTAFLEANRQPPPTNDWHLIFSETPAIPKSILQFPVRSEDVPDRPTYVD